LISSLASAQRNVGPVSNESHGSDAAGETHSVLTRAQMREAEGLLAGMGYWAGPVDGRFDPATRSALIAFQKWEGRPVTGKLTIDELEAIRTSAAPKPKDLGYAHVEVDLDRQVLLIVNDEGDVRVLPVSTGNGKPFIEEGEPSIAYTPRGRFVVYDKVSGWETGALGSMYYSNYISGGVAIHGHPNVPVLPASHGCIRIPMFAAREVSQQLPLGAIVLVYDKISFVSAKEWAENPRLKRDVLKNSTAPDYSYQKRITVEGKSFVIKKARSRIIRAELRNDTRALWTARLVRQDRYQNWNKQPQQALHQEE
jgi:L,D-transpeptidase catalytic domain/Putative peptidoglycan binding domain